MKSWILLLDRFASHYWWPMLVERERWLVDNHPSSRSVEPYGNRPLYFPCPYTIPSPKKSFVPISTTFFDSLWMVDPVHRVSGRVTDYHLLFDNSPVLRQFYHDSQSIGPTSETIFYNQNDRTENGQRRNDLRIVLFGRIRFVTSDILTFEEHPSYFRRLRSRFLIAKRIQPIWRKRVTKNLQFDGFINIIRLFQMFCIIVEGVSQMNSIVARGYIDRLFPFIGRLVQLIEKIVLFRLKQNLLCFFLDIQFMTYIWYSRLDRTYFHVQMNSKNGNLRFGFVLIHVTKGTCTAKETHFAQTDFRYICSSSENTHSCQVLPNTLPTNKGRLCRTNVVRRTF